MSTTSNDERLEQEAMEQLSRVNPAAVGPVDPKAEALYQRITSDPRPGSPAGWPKRIALAGAGFAAVAVVAVASFAVLGGGSGDGDDGGIAADQSVDDPGGLAGTCLAFSEDELLRREFAFRGEAREVSDTTTVTFEVVEWYAGDRGSEVTLELDSSLQSEMYNDFTFAEGEEYLVSGDGEYAWGCGYTRPFDGDLQGEWVAALSGESRAIGGDEAASCAFGFNAETLADRDHAFDGTVVAIDDGVGPGGIAYPDITFEVRESFNGADSGTVQLLGSALAYGYESSGAEAPSLQVGGRYLVAGDAEFAWGCGFTRTYSDTEAQVWRAAFDR